MNNIRLNARGLEITEVDNRTAAPFFAANHLQGHRDAAVAVALHDNSRIVACMSFSQHHTHGWEIIRAATLLGYTVRGGFSKMFAYFVKTRQPTSVMTFADRRLSTGRAYTLLGFKEVRKTSPNYYYTDCRNIYSRQQFQKHKLSKKLPVFDANLSESTNMFANGYRRLWDAGHVKLIWTS